MPSFVKGPNLRAPFGVNEFLRSTQDVKTESYTVAASTVPNETVDGNTVKNLRPGTVLAKVTSGADSGKVGPYSDAATDGRQTAANIVGINNTALPWQLGGVSARDVEVAVVKEARVYQDRCFEYVSSVLTALSDATAANMLGKKDVDIHFLTGTTEP